VDDNLKTYMAVDTEGKSHLELLIKVYDGAIKSYRTAEDLIKQEKLTDGREELERAKKFVVHLYTTLDPDKGGEVADNLGKLYSWVICQTMVAEASKDLAVIDDIVNVLSNLRNGWMELSKQQPKNEPVAAAPASDPEAVPAGFTTSA